MKNKLNQPDVEITTTTTGESINLNITIPSKQFTDIFATQTNTQEYKPPLEEVKKEWEDSSYIWEENDKFIFLSSTTENICIKIYKSLKLYYVKELGEEYYENVSFGLHQLLTKTFKALGWFDE